MSRCSSTSWKSQRSTGSGSRPGSAPVRNIDSRGTPSDAAGSTSAAIVSIPNARCAVAVSRARQWPPPKPTSHTVRCPGSSPVISSQRSRVATFSAPVAAVEVRALGRVVGRVARLGLEVLEIPERPARGADRAETLHDGRAVGMADRRPRRVRHGVSDSSAGTVIATATPFSSILRIRPLCRKSSSGRSIGASGL